MAADLYLGDASSQVYEFLATPRPCIFANPRRQHWRDDPDYAHWNAGAVVETLDQLDTALADAVTHPDRHRAVQQRMFDDTFDMTDRPSSERAATAIAAWLDRTAG